MIIDDTVKAYLCNERFDSDYKIDFSEAGRNISRIELLSEMITGKDVIHLGACDHKPLIEKKRNSGTWFHDILASRAKHIFGIDIDQDAISFCKSLGVDNIIYADITKDYDVVKESINTFDLNNSVIVAGELLEHIGNPVGFLKSINDNYADTVDEIIISVPNAYSAQNFLEAIHGRERINTDHRFWFTPYTLLKVCTDAGMSAEEIFLTDPPVGKKRGFFNIIDKKNLLYTELIIKCKLQR